MDLLHQSDIRDVVKAAYSGVESGGGRPLVSLHYTPEEIALLPEGAIAWSLGVGNPVASATIRADDIVLDLGTPAADALVTIDGLDTPVAPGSTIAAVAIAFAKFAGVFMPAIGCCGSVTSSTRILPI